MNIEQALSFTPLENFFTSIQCAKGEGSDKFSQFGQNARDYKPIQSAHAYSTNQNANS